MTDVVQGSQRKDWGCYSTSATADKVSSQMASVFVIVYLFVGRKLRSWMPLFVYAHVVTGEAPLTKTSNLAAS